MTTPLLRFYAFDLDGVLIRTEGLHDAAFHDALIEVGYPTLASTYRILSTNEPGLEAVSTRSKLRRLGRLDLLAEVKEAKDVFFLQCVNAGRVQASPWLSHDLLRVRRKAPIALVTNCTRAIANQILEAIDLGPDVFDAYIAPDSLDEPTKPDPHLYTRAAEAVDNSGTHWFGFEDSEAGLMAVRAAGGLAVKTNYHEMQERLRLCAF